MEIQHYLMIALMAALVIIFSLLMKLYHVKEQISFINDVLQDLKEGNLNRRVLAQRKDMTRQICYDINQIAISSQAQLVQQKQSKQAYKRLMTSLSHDVKTPLASLLGYLEAIENGIVTEKEKDEYIHVAYKKSQHLHHFVENLFEWVKLDSGEQTFHFERTDINELSRNMIADWIPVLETNHFDYDIDIPEQECFVKIDVHAYMRMLNNLIQNSITHSEGSKLFIRLDEQENKVNIHIADNGKGISDKDLPHIFERLYQGDDSRSSKGNGLGLAITKELVNQHQGTIIVNSTPHIGTEFIITLPKAL